MKSLLRLSVPYFSILVGFAVASTSLTAQRPGAPIEQWVNPGIGPSSSTDAVQFVRGTDGAFIGVLESTAASFADSRQDYLFTHLQFRVTDWLYNGKGRQNADRLDVLTIGGTYIDRGGQRVPTGIADIAKRLQVGGVYFVPVKYAYQANLPWYGKPLLAAPDALSALENEHVASVAPKSQWPQRIVERAVLTSHVPGAAPSERQRFIDAIRLAAARR